MYFRLESRRKGGLGFDGQPAVSALADNNGCNQIRDIGKEN